MRNVLLAGAALGAIAAIGVHAAKADDQPAAQTPAVFPVTTETDLAGYNGPSLNGAAPGSVQVNLGGRTFSALWFETNPSGTKSYNQSPQPQFMSYFFLYPGFDYASPNGVHFGAQAQIRATSSTQGEGAGTNATSPVPWFQQAWTYVSSPTYGKVQFGIAPGALTANAVGQADDFGEGLFFGWYSTDPYVPWVMGDAYDNYVDQQKIVYTSPTWAGITGAVSFQPTSVSMNYADNLTVGEPPGATGLLSRNRVELVGKYAGTFGATAVKANAAYIFADAEKSGAAAIGQHVSFGELGAQVTFDGFELEGQVETGQFNVALVDNGDPQGPLPAGAKGTTAFTLGLGYETGPIKVGAMYYGVQYDLADFGGPMGQIGHISGEGVGAAYTVGPGVVAYLDAYTASFDDPQMGQALGNNRIRQYPGGVGIGTFFTW